MLGLTQLPEDLLLRIVSFLLPPDIVRLRQVSRTLYSVTYQPVVWIRAYKNAALPRPPGPYLRPGDKEGLKFLERALLQSTKLEPWSARNFHLHAVRTFPRIGNFLNQWHFPQWGSWFITTIGSSVVYRNLHSDDPQTHVLFRLDDSSGGINRFMCADTVTLVGHPITYVLLKPRKSAYTLTLLKIVGHCRSSLSLEAAIPLSYPRHDDVHDLTVSPRYVCMYTSGASEDGEFSFALLDVTTEKIYHLPQSFKSTVVQTTEIRVMIHRFQKYDLGNPCEDEYSAIDLRLTPSSSPGIGTITLLQCTPLISLKGGMVRFLKAASSEDGFGRGVCCASRNMSAYIQTFSVDASGPVCRVDVGPRRDVSMLDPLEYRQFDPWTGETCHVMDDIRIHKFV